MHIKKLEICGFKSFVDRTVIHFDHDVIGVVGPNGCGKSNVVDAIRWAMGEQSAKALRGKAMGDVVFNGSETRPPAGFAEVTLTFDNSDPTMAQQLPLQYRDYSEIAVTRRAFRGDGSNDYFINKTPARLTDVDEVFLGTGVGRQAYSIIEQGKIGVIVSARAEDRRGLIEEAAGITKYKARRRQAENKMNLTRRNLVRVGDIVSEIERQVGSLKRQAAKARRFLRYRSELEHLMLWEASHKLLELIVLHAVAENSRAELTTKVASDRTEVDTRDAENEVLRQQAQDVEQQTERAQNAAFISDNDVRECETRQERAAERYVQLSGRLAQAQSEQLELERKATALDEEHQDLASQLETVEREQQSEQGHVQIEIDKLQALQLETDTANGRLATLRHDEAGAVASIARGEAELAGFEQRSNEMTQRQQRLSAEFDRLAEEQEQLESQRETLTEQVAQLVSRKHAMCDARDALQNELPTLRDDVRERGAAVEEQRAELNRRSNRLQALEEVSERMEGVGAGVRNLLQSGDPALGGIIADRIEVPAKFTAAVAGLVGDRLQCVVVDDLDRALELLRGLAAERQGRATIIPRQPSSATDPAHQPTPDLLTPPPSDTDDGVIGLLIDQVSFAPEDAAVVRALLGNALVVSDADCAKRLSAHQLPGDIVTQDGTVFHADGRITGGADDALAAGMLEQQREMRELGELVGTLTATQETAEEDLAALRERHGKLQDALDESKSEAHDAVIAMVTGEQDLQRLDQQLKLHSQRRDEVAAELSEIEQAIAAARGDQEQTLASLTEARQRHDSTSTTLAEAEQHAVQRREQLTEQQATYTERKVRFASISERTSACQAAVVRVGREHTELSERLAALESERLAAATEAGQVAATIFASRGELLDAKVAARAAHVAFESAREGLDDARHSLVIREAELREMRATLQELTEQLQTHEMELQRLTLEREHLEEGVRDRFRGLELAKVVGDYHAKRELADGERQRIRELTQLIDRMGSVNLDAMQEYETAAERYTFFTEQRDDLEKALADLEKAISQMDRVSRRLFKHAFEGISRRFTEIFPKMFRGGKGELRLTDPDDMLGTGIDILAQPPGKRLGHIELLSGGEKAFTAVSLLLAIFRFKPSPFSILDEVDAPLDDANVGRFIEAIRAMTDRSQFIVITHSKRTMQAVDVLYGVTMQEPGVSKLVGVRVGEAQNRSVTHRLSEPAPPMDGTPSDGTPSDGQQVDVDGDGVDAVAEELAAEETSQDPSSAVA